MQPGGETFHRRERLILRRPSENEYRVCSVDTRQTKVFTVEGMGDQALLRSVEDPFGNRVVFGYDGAHLRQIVDASGRTIRIDWHQGRIILVAVEQGPSTRYDYDEQGRLVRVTDACGSCDTFVESYKGG